ncbi:GNAT family N-acetyltransferase [Sphingomonas colocasiae]|uniref:GNAT family N-acetyltransferase n=1 Tax=Sphingomonas colocasiae TaxID=1848973 RepID=UPI0031BB9E0B
MTHHLEITTPRSVIAPLADADAADVQRITDASVTARVSFLPSPFTLEDTYALIAARADRCFHGVRDRATGELHGVIGVHGRPFGMVEIGYWFAAAARGRGLATEAVDAALTALEDLPGCNGIEAECALDNHPSWGLLEKLGFRATGDAGQRPERMLMRWHGRPGIRIDVC